MAPRRSAGGRGRRPPPGRGRARPPRRRDGGSDLGARLAAAIPAIIFAIVIVAQGGLVFTLGIMALGLVCLHELYAMLEEAAPARLAGFAGFIALLLSAQYGGPRQLLLVLVALLPVLFLVSLAQVRTSTVGMGVTLLGVWWVGLALAHAVLLRRLPHGDGIVVDVLVGTFLGDTGAYIGGRWFGRRRLAPRISPNKTLEGLIAGIVTAIVAVWFASIYQDWLSSDRAVLLGLGVALAAPVGDLFESFIKRDVGTKDTGRFFGAHGGALDRLDAVLFSAVVGYYVWYAMLH